MQIQQVEKRTGLSAQSIRFYEREGLIQPERNPENRYRNYTEEDVRRLNSIAFCRSMGISVSAIRRLLAGEVTLQSCVEDALLDARAAEAEARRTAELCRSVLDQLRTQPALSLEESVSVVLAVPKVRALYEQVLASGSSRGFDRPFDYPCHWKRCQFPNPAQPRFGVVGRRKHSGILFL